MMKPTKTVTPHDSKPSPRHHGGKYLYTLATVSLLAGFLLMCGEGSDFTHFCPEIFSPLRIRLAPLLCLLGYLLVAWAIMYRPKEHKKGTTNR